MAVNTCYPAVCINGGNETLSSTWKTAAESGAVVGRVRVAGKMKVVAEAAKSAGMKVSWLVQLNAITDTLATTITEFTSLSAELRAIIIAIEWGNENWANPPGHTEGVGPRFTGDQYGTSFIRAGHEQQESILKGTPIIMTTRLSPSDKGEWMEGIFGKATKANKAEEIKTALIGNGTELNPQNYVQSHPYSGDMMLALSTPTNLKNCSDSSGYAWGGQRWMQEAQWVHRETGLICSVAITEYGHNAPSGTESEYSTNATRARSFFEFLVKVKESKVPTGLLPASDYIPRVVFGAWYSLMGNNSGYETFGPLNFYPAEAKKGHNEQGTPHFYKTWVEGAAKLTAAAEKEEPPPVEDPEHFLLGSYSESYSHADKTGAGREEAYQFTCAHSGTAVELKMFVQASPGVTSVKLGILADNANKPGAVLAQGTYTGTPVGPEWISASGISQALVAGTKYWLTELPIGGELKFNVSNAGGLDWEAKAVGLVTITQFPLEAEWEKFNEGPVGFQAISGTLAPTIVPIGPQESAKGVPIAGLQVEGTGISTYEAEHLPVGLEISSVTGKIVGTPSKLEEPTVTIRVVGEGGTAETSFKWKIAELVPTGFTDQFNDLSGWTLLNAGSLIVSGKRVEYGTGTPGATRAFEPGKGNFRIVGSIVTTSVVGNEGQFALMGISSSATGSKTGNWSSIGIDGKGRCAFYQGATQTLLGTGLGTGTWLVTIVGDSAGVSFTVVKSDRSVEYRIHKTRAEVETLAEGTGIFRAVIYNSEEHKTFVQIAPMGATPSLETVPPRENIEGLGSRAYNTRDASGKNIRLEFASSYTSGVAPKGWLLFAHGATEKELENSPIDGASRKAMFKALLEAGYCVATSSFSGESTFGNLQTGKDYKELYDYLHTNYPSSAPIILMGFSAGGLATCLAFRQALFPCAGMLLISAATNLEYLKLHKTEEPTKGFVDLFCTAYGIISKTGTNENTMTNYAEAITAKDLDPNAAPASEYRGLPVGLMASPEDTLVLKTENAAKLKTKLEGHQSFLKEVATSGAHASETEFPTTATVNLLKEMLEVASPVISSTTLLSSGGALITNPRSISGGIKTTTTLLSRGGALITVSVKMTEFIEGDTSTFTLKKQYEGENVQATFAFGENRTEYSVAQHLVSNQIVTNNEYIKQGLRDSGLFIET